MAPPANNIPPELPPSVEAAYRAKCIQLKTRLNEIEESNDTARQRLSRLKRSIQKQRLERAFLLEQVAKRTSTNVEDSEGSPSPPPTPKEKPLRTKRGHRKPDFLTTDLGDGRTGSAFVQQGGVTLSPSSDAFSHTHHDALRNSTPQAHMSSTKRTLPSNGTYPSQASSTSAAISQLRRPKNVLDLYYNETRPILANEYRAEIADGTYDIEGALARGWSTLDNDKKNEFTQRFEQMKRTAEGDKDDSSGPPRKGVFDTASGTADDRDEDVEMDDVETPNAAGGFTAVNRG